MKTLSFQIEIASTPQEVWHTLWTKDLYTQWTKPFTEGCYYETSSFSVGSEIKFLSGSGGGLLSKIVQLIPEKHVAFEHLSMFENNKIMDFKTSDDTHQYIESYEIIDQNNGVLLMVKVDTQDPWEKMMLDTFPNALLIVKEITESRFV